MKVALGSRGMTAETERQYALDREEWRALERMWMIECDATILLGSCVLSERPPAHWWLTTWRVVG